MLYVKGASPVPIRLEQLYVGVIVGVVPFIRLQLAGLGLTLAFPQIALWLPTSLMR